MGQFMPKKRHFWSRNGNYPRFFGVFLTSDEPGSSKTGLRSILVVGEIRHVIESTGFSSPTGPQEAQTDPQEAQRDPQESLEKTCIFFRKKKVFHAGGRHNLLAVTRGRLPSNGNRKNDYRLEKHPLATITGSILGLGTLGGD